MPVPPQTHLYVASQNGGDHLNRIQKLRLPTLMVEATNAPGALKKEVGVSNIAQRSRSPLACPG